MAAAAFLGSAFCIYVTNDTASTFTVAQPTDFSSYKIVKVSVYNSGGTPNFTMTDGIGNIVATAATVAGGWKDMVIDTSRSTITSTENLVITTAAATTTQIVIHCIGAGIAGDNTDIIGRVSTVAQSLSVV